MEYQQSFQSHSIILIVVVPIGNIPMDVFEKYLKVLVDNSTIPIQEFPNILNWPNYSQYTMDLWDVAKVSLGFITEDTYLSKDFNTQYNKIFPHLRVYGMIGIYDTTFGLSREAAYSEFIKISSEYPDVKIKQALMFDNSIIDKSHVYDELITKFHRQKAEIGNYIPKYEDNIIFPSILIHDMNNLSANNRGNFAGSSAAVSYYKQYYEDIQINPLLNTKQNSRRSSIQELPMPITQQSESKTNDIQTYLSTTEIMYIEKQYESLDIYESFIECIHSFCLYLSYNILSLFNKLLNDLSNNYVALPNEYTLTKDKKRVSNRRHIYEASLALLCGDYIRSRSLYSFQYDSCKTLGDEVGTAVCLEGYIATLVIESIYTYIYNDKMTEVNELLVNTYSDECSLIYKNKNLNNLAAMFYLKLCRLFISLPISISLFINNDSNTNILKKSPTFVLLPTSLARRKMVNYYINCIISLEMDHYSTIYINLNIALLYEFWGYQRKYIYYLIQCIHNIDTCTCSTLIYQLYTYIYKLIDIELPISTIGDSEKMSKPITIWDNVQYLLLKTSESTVDFMKNTNIYLYHIIHILAILYKMKNISESVIQNYMEKLKLISTYLPEGYKCTCRFPLLLTSIQYISLATYLLPYHSQSSSSNFIYCPTFKSNSKVEPTHICVCNEQVSLTLFIYNPFSFPITITGAELLFENGEIRTEKSMNLVASPKNISKYLYIFTPITPGKITIKSCLINIYDIWYPIYESKKFSPLNLEVTPSLPVLIPLASSTPSSSRTSVYTGQLLNNIYRMQILTEEISTLAITIKLIRGIQNKKKDYMFDGQSPGSSATTTIKLDSSLNNSDMSDTVGLLSLPLSSLYPSVYHTMSTIFWDVDELYKYAKLMPLKVGTLMELKFHIHVLEPIQVEIKIAYTNSKNPTLYRCIENKHAYFPKENCLVREIDIFPIRYPIPEMFTQQQQFYSNDTTSEKALLSIYLPSIIYHASFNYQTSILSSLKNTSSSAITSLTYILCVPAYFIMSKETIHSFDKSTFTYKNTKYIFNIDRTKLSHQVLLTLYQYIYYFTDKLHKHYMKYTNINIDEITNTYVLYEQKEKYTTSSDSFLLPLFRQFFDYNSFNKNLNQTENEKKKKLFINIEHVCRQTIFVFWFNTHDTTLHSMSNLPDSYQHSLTSFYTNTPLELSPMMTPLSSPKLNSIQKEVSTLQTTESTSPLNTKENNKIVKNACLPSFFYSSPIQLSLSIKNINDVQSYIPINIEENDSVSLTDSSYLNLSNNAVNIFSSLPSITIESNTTSNNNSLILPVQPYFRNSNNHDLTSDLSLSTSIYQEYSACAGTPITLSFAITKYLLLPQCGLFHLFITDINGNVLLSYEKTYGDVLYTGTISKVINSISSSELPSHSVTVYFINKGVYFIYASILLMEYNRQYWCSTPILLHSI